MITIAVDCMGGDHGPKVTLPACRQFLDAHPDVNLILVGLPATVAVDLMTSPRTVQASKLGEIPPIRPELQNRKRAVRLELDDGRVVNLPLYRNKEDVFKIGRRVRLHYHSVLDSILLFDGPARDASSYGRLCALESAVTKEQADRIISLSQNLADEALIVPE
jgi:hypothetical protein